MHLSQFHVTKWQLSVTSWWFYFLAKENCHGGYKRMLSKLKYMSVFLNKYAKSPLFNLINSNCIMQMKDKEKELAQLETLGSVPIYHSVTQSPRVTCESNISVLRALAVFLRMKKVVPLFQYPLLEMYLVTRLPPFLSKRRTS